MSNSSLEQYKELYSKYLEYAVTVHNQHHVFIHHLGRDSKSTMRKCLKEMMRIEKQLLKLCQQAYLEKRALKQQLWKEGTHIGRQYFSTEDSVPSRTKSKGKNNGNGNSTTGKV